MTRGRPGQRYGLRASSQAQGRGTAEARTALEQQDGPPAREKVSLEGMGRPRRLMQQPYGPEADCRAGRESKLSFAQE